MPAVHGTYDGVDLESLDPADEDELTTLIEALHPEFWSTFRSGGDAVINGEPVNPRLHVVAHQVAAEQLRTDIPPDTWLTVQRLSESGYNWHNIMHMIGMLVMEDVYRAGAEGHSFDREDYARRLGELPPDGWPPPAEAADS
jgi:hypothetical protein